MDRRVIREKRPIGIRSGMGSSFLGPASSLPQKESQVILAGMTQDWAARLHRLWLSVARIESREELAGLVLPPLQSLPGVVGVWAVRHGAHDRVLEYRWTGLPLAGRYRAVARELARHTG